MKKTNFTLMTALILLFSYFIYGPATEAKTKALYINSYTSENPGHRKLTKKEKEKMLVEFEKISEKAHKDFYKKMKNVKPGDKKSRVQIAQSTSSGMSSGMKDALDAFGVTEFGTGIIDAIKGHFKKLAGISEEPAAAAEAEKLAVKEGASEAGKTAAKKGAAAETEKAAEKEKLSTEAEKVSTKEGAIGTAAEPEIIPLADAETAQAASASAITAAAGAEGAAATGTADGLASLLTNAIEVVAL